MKTLNDIKSTKLQEAKLRLQAKREARELAKWEDENFVEQQLINQMEEDAYVELLQLESQAKAIIDEAQVIINGEVVEYRDYMGIRGFGKAFERLTNLVNNIIYSVDQCKPTLLEDTGLSELTGIKFLEAIGQTQIWSKRNQELYEETSYDLDLAEFYLVKIKEQLGLEDLPTLPLTEERQQARYTLAKTKSQEAKDLYDEALQRRQMALMV